MKRAPDADALPVMQCATGTLRRAARAATRLYDCVLRPTGMNVAQFTLLHALARAGPLTQGRLGQALALDSTTLSRTLRPLEARKWVRGDPGKDRRERVISLTSPGRAQLERARPAWEGVQRRLKARLGPQRWDALLRELALLAGIAGRV